MHKTPGAVCFRVFSMAAGNGSGAARRSVENVSIRNRRIKGWKRSH